MNTERRRAIARLVVAVGITCLLAIAIGAIVHRYSWSSAFLACGWSVTSITSGMGYLRRTRGRS
jgi:hypothetical protein